MLLPGSQHDVVPQAAQPPDEMVGDAAAGPPVQERLAEVPKADPPRQHVERGGQDLMGDRDGGPHRATAGLQAVVLVLVVAAFGPGGAHRGRDEGGLEADVALARTGTPAFAGALTAAGAHAGP